MTHGCEVPLDSYRLAKYALQAPCFVCDGPNAIDHERCRHCHAPMALSHQAFARKTPPKMISLLGTSGAGKTVYLGMLMDMLSRQAAPWQVLARGAFSISLQQHTTASLARCEFPEKTPNEAEHWNWVHCLVTAQGRKPGAELIMPDMAGEAILQEIDHPNSYPAIRSLLRKSSGILLLLDSQRLEAGHRDQEHFALKLLALLDDLSEGAKRHWRTRPISITFSKADHSDGCYDDPAAFARENCSALWRLCSERFPKVAYFSCGVAGSCAYRNYCQGLRARIPLRIEPRGIREPFANIVEALAKNPKG